MDKDSLPSACKQETLTTKVGDELVVFNTATNTASCLNKFTAAVWVACDGMTSFPALRNSLINAGFPDASDDTIWIAINELQQAGLLEEGLEIPDSKQWHMKRRELLCKLGAGSAAVLPMVSAINIQPAIAQTSCVSGFHSPCTIGGLPCCPPYFCKNGKCKP